MLFSVGVISWPLTEDAWFSIDMYILLYIEDKGTWEGIEWRFLGGVRRRKEMKWGNSISIKNKIPNLYVLF